MDLAWLGAFENKWQIKLEDHCSQLFLRRGHKMMVSKPLSYLRLKSFKRLLQYLLLQIPSADVVSSYIWQRQKFGKVFDRWTGSDEIYFIVSFDLAFFFFLICCDSMLRVTVAGFVSHLQFSFIYFSLRCHSNLKKTNFKQFYLIT